MIIAVDTGGTKTLVACFSKNGHLLTSKKIPTPDTTKQYILSVSALISELCNQKAPTIISLAIPDYQGKSLIPVFTNLPWKDFDAKRAFAEFFPDSTILIGNDAKLGGLGEVRSMNPMPTRGLYVTISTGIGNGVVTHGRIDRDFIRSEAGKMVLEYDGVLRKWESFASGKAIYEAYHKNGSDITSERTWRQIADRISRGFFALLPVVQPELVIIGGSMGVHFDNYSDHLEKLLDEKLPPTVIRPRFVRAIHPEEAVAYGCYYHAIDSVK